ncbi:uncharacterized protein LOC106673258 isoform X2 [Cimex lectularius]|uniref:Uncharacterized protein n=1 Tax=Cimex lectularius TaxID=79782 RepID=A0A8I6S814_CIMLE|nr:uncharacterized protein LOC106673258 isoform X2 [Cimex lectularius]
MQYASLNLLVCFLLVFASLILTLTIIFILGCGVFIAWEELNDDAEADRDDRFIKARKDQLDDDPLGQEESRFSDTPACHNIQPRAEDLPECLPRMRLPGSPGYDCVVPNMIQKAFMFKSQTKLQERTVFLHQQIRRRKRL